MFAAKSMNRNPIYQQQVQRLLQGPSPSLNSNVLEDLIFQKGQSMDQSLWYQLFN